MVSHSTAFPNGLQTLSCAYLIFKYQHHSLSLQALPIMMFVEGKIVYTFWVAFLLSLTTGPAAKAKLCSIINLTPALDWETGSTDSFANLGLLQRNNQDNTLSCFGHGSIMLVETVCTPQTDSYVIGLAWVSPNYIISIWWSYLPT